MITFCNEDSDDIMTIIIIKISMITTINVISTYRMLSVNFIQNTAAKIKLITHQIDPDLVHV